MIGQPGFIRLHLLRSLVDDAEMRYINIAERASDADLERGYANPEWQASVQGLLKDPDLRVTAQPRVYEVAWNCIPATICRESSAAVAHGEPNHGADGFPS
jgi:hypothetical protein